jgi:Arc/MetJ-type ribon-helix-helix transcriptional regulator
MTLERPSPISSDGGETDDEWCDVVEDDVASRLEQGCSFHVFDGRSAVQLLPRRTGPCDHPVESDLTAPTVASQIATVAGVSTQIAVRLPEDLVDFIDQLVASGRASSRAAVVSQALRRERRREVAARDAAILAAAGEGDDLDELARHVVDLPLDDLD